MRTRPRSRRNLRVVSELPATGSYRLLSTSNTHSQPTHHSDASTAWSLVCDCRQTAVEVEPARPSTISDEDRITTSSQLTTLPPMLFLALKRFTSTFSRSATAKIPTPVAFAQHVKVPTTGDARVVTYVDYDVIGSIVRLRASSLCAFLCTTRCSSLTPPLTLPVTVTDTHFRPWR
jgi:hypothetical protein